MMGDALERAVDLLKRAESKRKRKCWRRPKYEDAADLYYEAGDSFKLAESWSEAGFAYMEAATCFMELRRKFEAAQLCVSAAYCYLKTEINEAIPCLESAANLFGSIDRLALAARYSKEIADLYKSTGLINNAIRHYGRSADFYEKEGLAILSTECKEKMGELYFQQKQYQISIQIFENIATQSVNHPMMSPFVKEYLLNAGICQILIGDFTANASALERYQELDPTFPETCEYRLLADIAAISNEDVRKITEVIQGHGSGSNTTLDSWRKFFLSRVKEELELYSRRREEEAYEKMTQDVPKHEVKAKVDREKGVFPYLKRQGRMKKKQP